MGKTDGYHLNIKTSCMILGLTWLLWISAFLMYKTTAIGMSFSLVICLIVGYTIQLLSDRFEGLFDGSRHYISSAILLVGSFALNASVAIFAIPSGLAADLALKHKENYRSECIYAGYLDHAVEKTNGHEAYLAINPFSEKFFVGKKEISEIMKNCKR